MDLSFLPQDWNEVSPRSQLPHEPPEDEIPGQKTMQQNKKGTLISSLNIAGNFPTLGRDCETLLETNNELQDAVDPLPVEPSSNIDFQSLLPPDPLGLLQNEPKDEQNLQDDLTFRVETKQVFICTYGGCNKKYARIPDLRRHHRGAHQGNHQFKCRAGRCERATRGFSRRDKRDTHEKSMHLKRGERLSG